MSPDLELTQIGEVTKIPYLERAYQHARILEKLAGIICGSRLLVRFWDSIVFEGVRRKPLQVGERNDTESEVVDVLLALDLCDGDVPGQDSPPAVDDNVLPVEVSNTNSDSLETVNAQNSVVTGMSF